MEIKYCYKPEDLYGIFSKKQLDLHFYKHHCQYEKNLPNFVKHYTLEEILVFFSNSDIKSNAEQIWNHNLFWKSLSYEQNLEDKIFVLKHIKIIESMKNLKIMGSGWIWCFFDGEFKTSITSNSERPNGIPIFVIDIWEHAYYVDFENERQNFVSTVIDKYLNWSFIKSQIINLI